MTDIAGGALTPAQQAAEIREFIQIASDTQTGNYLTALSLRFFTTYLTYSRELDLVWNYRLSKSSVLFVIMRYGNIIVQGIGLAYYLWPSPPFTFCKAWFYSEEWVSDILFIPVSIFLGLRTYALYHGQGAFYKWFIFSAVVLTNLVLFVSLSVATVQVKFSEPSAGLTCSFTISAPPETAGLLQFIASTCFDFTIFVLCAVRCYQHYKAGNIRLIKIIFKACLAYFAFLFTSGLTSLVLYKTLPPERAALRGVLLNPMRTAAVIITSRMVLSIRSIVLNQGPLTTRDLTAFPDGSNVSNTSLQCQRVASRSAQQTSTFEMEMDDRDE
ncbi:hypothetical protein C8R44DRAFT_876264 [Mycena epipterygia]|nr:hypothetical protein C8R44DRAFT_876264 [Mycena epipterygia]